MGLMTKKSLLTVASAATVGFAAAATATPVTYSYDTTVGFDPTATVGAGGQNAGQLVDELFGPGIGSTGTADVSGSFTYDSTASKIGGNNASAGYDAITGANVTFNNSNTAHANINTIRNNRGSSDIGFASSPNGAFCGDTAGCNDVGLSLTPTGNVVQTVNNSRYFITGPNGIINFSTRDAISFGIGGTDSNKDFSPAIKTDTFGKVSVDEVNLTLNSQQSADFFDSTNLPEDLSLLSGAALKSSIFSIDFSGPQLPNDVILKSGAMKGNATSAAVPEPGSLGVIAFALALLGFGTFKHRKRG